MTEQPSLTGLKTGLNLRSLALTMALAITMALGACSEADKGSKTGIYLDNAYIKTAVPGRSITAAYATIINHDPQRLCLEQFSATFAQSIELHTVESTGGPDSGRVRMRQLDQLCLRPGEHALLEPGGMHLMVMGLDGLPSPAPQAEPVAIVIGTADGRAFKGLFRVQPFNQ